MAMEFYQNLYTVDSIVAGLASLPPGFPVISSSDLEFISNPFTAKEVKSASWDMDSYKAPGPDGFQAVFFQKSWAILGADLINMALSFLNGGALPVGACDILITLLPKVEVLESISQFRPGNVGDHHRVPIVKWETVTKPMDQGGLGVRTCRIMNDAFLMKLGWKLLSDDGALWCSVLRNKYMAGLRGLNHMVSRTTSSNLWKGILYSVEALRAGSFRARKATPNDCFSVKSAYRSIGGVGFSRIVKELEEVLLKILCVLYAVMQLNLYHICLEIMFLFRVFGESLCQPLLGSIFSPGMWILWLEHVNLLEMCCSVSASPSQILFVTCWWIWRWQNEEIFRGNLGRSGEGGLLRDDGGRWLKSFVLRLGTYNSMLTEISTLLFGLQLAWNSGYRKVEVDTDSLATIHLVLGSLATNARYSSLLLQIHRLLKRSWQVPPAIVTDLLHEDVQKITMPRLIQSS
ncbi:hypothetical protein GH714_034735 [Hevea brasiliensis]|uniref:RNase H type-1 domain-containing protein n=1 Tax=Hevea brasiliensis TaxID=3981 RepID=A0A6A6M680_HEVBR|nr:hypothetical protein GH714_034735 [Hevea brasiliensis]